MAVSLNYRFTHQTMIDYRFTHQTMTDYRFTHQTMIDYRFTHQTMIDTKPGIFHYFQGSLFVGISKYIARITTNQF